MNFILFNGPPRSGKDTAARAVYDYIDADRSVRFFPVWEKFSYANKRAFAGAMDLGVDRWGTVDLVEHTKDDIIPILGVSYRQWQIDFSEKFMKPLYGDDIFGRLLLHRCEMDVQENGPDAIYIVSDCGFQTECDLLRDHNVLLFVMNRDGCTFEGDSREVVTPHPGWTYHNVNNNVPIEEMRQFVCNMTGLWMSLL